MAGRIRSIKPEILEDAKSAGLDDHAWRLWVSLWMLADDYGCFHCHSERQVHGAVFWGTETDPSTTSEALARLARESLVTLYTVRGQRYGRITNWDRHQRVVHPGKPRVPGPSDPDANVIAPNGATLARVSRESNDSRAPDPDLRPPISDPDPDPDPEGPAGVCGEDASLAEPDGEPEAAPDWRTAALDAAFMAYPRPLERSAGHKLLRSQLTERADGDKLLAAVRNYASEVRGREQSKIKLWPSFARVWRDYVTLETHRPAAASTAAANRTVSNATKPPSIPEAERVNAEEARATIAQLSKHLGRTKPPTEAA